MKNTTSPFTIGLDLGQAHDPTAIAILEKVERPKNAEREAQPSLYHCRHLERFALRTSYPDIVSRVKKMIEDREVLQTARLVVDATGVGRPVVDMIREAGLKPIGVIITGGDTPAFADRMHRVPKRNLVSIVQVLLQENRLLFSETLPDTQVLITELLNFQVKINEKANDSYGAWREGTHDDLVLAVALAAWQAEKPEPAIPQSTTVKKRYFN